MIFSNFEVNSFHSKQVSADNSAVAVSNLKEISTKYPAKKVRAANVNRTDALDNDNSFTDQSGRIVTTKPAQHDEHNDHPKSIKDESLQQSEAEDAESPDTKKALKAAEHDTLEDY